MKNLIKSGIFAVFLLISSYASAKIHEVQVSNFQFTPETLDVFPGDTVKWIWVSGIHTTTSVSVPAGASLWDHPVNSSNTEFLLMLDAPGEYNYECSFHSAMMKGFINVDVAQNIPENRPGEIQSKTFPVPFSEILTIEFFIPQSGITVIDIYDLTGKPVKTVIRDFPLKGKNNIEWDGTNEQGTFVDSGIYFYIIKAGDSTISSGKIVFDKKR